MMARTVSIEMWQQRTRKMYFNMVAFCCSGMFGCLFCFCVNENAIYFRFYFFLAPFAIEPLLIPVQLYPSTLFQLEFVNFDIAYKVRKL